MDAHCPDSTFAARAERRRFARTERTLAAVAVGSCLAVFGATGVAGAATLPDVTPIFCTNGVGCGDVSSNPPATTPPLTKKEAEAAKKEAKRAAEEAKKDAKEAAKEAKKGPKSHHATGGSLKQFLGDSSVVDNGGHRWG